MAKKAIEDKAPSVDNVAALSFLDNLSQCISVKDVDGKVVFVNTSFLKLSGMGYGDLIGKTDFDLYPKALAEKYRADDERVMSRGKQVELIEKHISPSGDELYVKVVKVPTRDSDGGVTGVQCIFWDITKQTIAASLMALSSSTSRRTWAKIGR